MHPFKVFRSAEYAIVGIRSFPFFPRTFHLFPQKKRKKKKNLRSRIPDHLSSPPEQFHPPIPLAASTGHLLARWQYFPLETTRRVTDDWPTGPIAQKKKTTSVSSASSLSTYPHTTHLTFDALVPKVNFSVHRRTRSARSCTISAGEQSQLTVVYFLAWIVPAHVAPTCNTFGAKRFLINGQNGRTFPLQTKRATDAGRNKVKTFPPTGE